jgi:hypothetical protein
MATPFQPLLRVTFAALVGFALLAAPVERAVGASTPVTVTTSATSPALTSSVDDPGRVVYQSIQKARSCEQHCLHLRMGRALIGFCALI